MFFFFLQSSVNLFKTFEFFYYVRCVFALLSRSGTQTNQLSVSPEHDSKSTVRSYCLKDPSICYLDKTK